MILESMCPLREFGLCFSAVWFIFLVGMLSDLVEIHTIQKDQKYNHIQYGSHLQVFSFECSDLPASDLPQDFRLWGNQEAKPPDDTS